MVQLEADPPLLMEKYKYILYTDMFYVYIIYFGLYFRQQARRRSLQHLKSLTRMVTVLLIGRSSSKWEFIPSKWPYNKTNWFIV